jgi:hypothetical protein
MHLEWITCTSLIHIPFLEAQVDEDLSYYEIELQASEDYSAFSLAVPQLILRLRLEEYFQLMLAQNAKQVSRPYFPY